MDNNYRELGFAIVQRALKDYIHKDATEAERDSILDFLSSNYAKELSDGLAYQAFLKLLDDEESIRNNMAGIEDEDDEVEEEVSHHVTPASALEYCSSLTLGARIIDIETNRVGTYEGWLYDGELTWIQLCKDDVIYNVAPENVLAVADWMPHTEGKELLNNDT